MSLTIWSNHTLRPDADVLLQKSLQELGCRLIQSTRSSKSVLTQGESDPTLAEADVAYGQPAPADVLATPGLRWVSLSTAGYTRYDTVDFREAMAGRGTVVTNASGVFANPCAEHALAMMMAFTRQIPSNVLNGVGPREWRYLEGRYSIELLTGSTVMILGYGAIGRRLTELLAAFRCRVIGVRRSPVPEPGVEVVSFAAAPERLAEVRHVVNCLPDADSTRRWCDATFFRRMASGSYFYNVGRGTTVDQEALAAALASGQLGGAFLDTLDPEPLPPEHFLWRAPRCHITPHLAGGHRGQDESLVTHFIGNLRRFMAGEPLMDRILSQRA
jgi:phosphoglycerate dehydrogenase-like enzyme